jgi:hypothetical protein
MLFMRQSCRICGEYKIEGLQKVLEAEIKSVPLLNNRVKARAIKCVFN